jgi:hypothetical protein
MFVWNPVLTRPGYAGEVQKQKEDNGKPSRRTRLGFSFVHLANSAQM